VTFKKREFKGIQIVMGNNVQLVNQSKFLVRSQSDPRKWYEVTWQRDRWICNCDDFSKHNKKCKHIYAVNYYLVLKEAALGIRSLNNESCCPYCGSSSYVIKRGFRYNRNGPVQRYHCKHCKKRFRDETAFEGMRNRAITIITALDLYYRGVSLRQIVQHVESCYGIKVSHGTVYNWIRKFVNLINEYINTLQIATSERWHADETLVKVSGRHLVLWALMDSETRFLIALHISQKRGAEDAEILIKKAIEASTNKPLEMVTDGACSYEAAIKKEFLENKDCGNEALIHLKGPLTMALNNKMERFFRTLKGRLKTMYRIYNEQTAKTFTDGFSVYYNFIKPHKSLNNKTPAHAAGLFPDKASWLNLILEAKTQNLLRTKKSENHLCSEKDMHSELNPQIRDKEDN